MNVTFATEVAWYDHAKATYSAVVLDGIQGRARNLRHLVIDIVDLGAPVRDADRVLADDLDADLLAELVDLRANGAPRDFKAATLHVAEARHVAGAEVW